MRFSINGRELLSTLRLGRRIGKASHEEVEMVVEGLNEIIGS
jgi:hypothetical protein